MTAGCGRQVGQHAPGVAVTRVPHTWGGLLGNVDLSHCCKASPHLCLSWDVKLFCLAYVVFLIEVYFNFALLLFVIDHKHYII